MSPTAITDDPTAVEEPAASAPSSSRRRRLLMLIVVLVVLLVAELAARVLERRMPERLVFYDSVAQVKDHQLDDVAAAGGADVVVLGNSMALFAVLPDRLSSAMDGSPVYNAGLTAGVPEISSDWFDRFVRDRTHPETVVWVLASPDFNDSVVVPPVTQYQDSLVVRDDLWARLDRAASRVSALVRNRRELRDPKDLFDALRGRPGPVERIAPLIDDGGALTAYTLPLNAAAEQQLRGGLADYTIGGRIAEVVERSVAAWEAAGIDVILAEGPLPERSVPLHPGGAADLEAFQQELAAIAERTGATVVPLPGELRANDLFQDYTHLNEEGSRRYTDYLAGVLGGLGGR